ncbi:basal cell adhesion molecule-like [Megalops cyprinoides]|uniref:basal cell adhesion molecule-like n=1 Tax=Megalops cyprinoides TaxID=118141 RepID=UPI0018649149|nr:basal cell adhesion molecule-like [Megalops cyprinoides]
MKGIPKSRSDLAPQTPQSVDSRDTRCWCAVTVTVTPTVEVMKGETATLTCSFTVSTPTSNSIVEWFIEEIGTRTRVAFTTQSGGEGAADDGTKLSGRVSIGKDFSLSISPVQVEDDRRFHCQVTAGAAGVGEGATQLKVYSEPEKPELTSLPEAVAITDKETEMGHCVTKGGHPEPRLVWYKDSNPLSEAENREQMYLHSSVVREVTGLYTVSSTLYLRPQREDKKAVFYCRVEYGLPKGAAKNKDSDTFSLPLLYPTEHVTFAVVSSGPVKEGDSVEIRCEADGNPKPDYDFTFKKEGGVDVKKEAPQGVLTLPSATRDDAGVYRCEALDFDSSPDVELTKELTLLVHYLDPVTISPAGPVTTSLGGSVELTCATQASDQLTLQWKKGSSVVSEAGALELKAVSFADAGVYSCVATMPSVPGLQAQANITINVAGKPEIDAPSNGEVQKEGEAVTLSCSAQGYPSPKFTWTPPGKETVTVQGNKVVSTVSLEATASVLKNGVTCNATNEHGSDSKHLQVVISEANPPPPPSPIADKQEGDSSGVVIAVVVSLLLLLLLLAILLYVLWRMGKLPCGTKEKKGEEATNGTAVEMKSDKANEEAGLLNKPPTTEQGAEICRPSSPM